MTPHVMDIFNHGYSNQSSGVIPTTVEVYSVRSNAFDYNIMGNVYSKLDVSNPIEPFLLTHMGLRMHLLLLPGLYVDQFGSDRRPVISQGDLSGQVWNYNLLDRRLYSRKHYSLRDVLFFGVINFSVKDGIIRIANPCISIPLNCKDQQPGCIQSSENIHIPYFRQEMGPPVFNLRTSKDPERQNPSIEVAEKDLKVQGLQCIMSYL